MTGVVWHLEAVEPKLTMMWRSRALRWLSMLFCGRNSHEVVQVKGDGDEPSLAIYKEEGRYRA